MSNALSLTTSLFLHIESISFSDFSDEQVNAIKKVARKWEKTARLFAQYESTAQPVFEDAALMAQDLLNHLCVFNEKDLCNPYPKGDSELILCKDASENIQAMSVVDISSTQINIKYLMTHPNNIRAPFTDHPRVVGAGSSVINYLKGRMERNKSIQAIALTALSSAVQFYEKHNFLSLRGLSFNLFSDEGMSERVLYTDMIFLRQRNEDKSVA